MFSEVYRKECWQTSDISCLKSSLCKRARSIFILSSPDYVKQAMKCFLDLTSRLIQNSNNCRLHLSG